MMPQESDQLEYPSHSSAYEGSVEPNERLLKPTHRSPRQRNGSPSENGSVTSGTGKPHSNGLVVSANGGFQTHAKCHTNGYVCELVFTRAFNR